ncbi:MAG: outer membrane protein assembly factor BamE [Gammaproteobacteria bacterium]|nr:outer membrane protein assembly factor BamE [Gammaproteobacteria bacterium]
MKIKRFILPILTALSLTHCLSHDFSNRITQQGNLIPASKMARIKVGMSKQDVIQLMGSSLVHHVFDENHLDYAYTWRQGSGNMKQRYLCLTFQHDRLSHIDYHATPHS